MPKKTLKTTKKTSVKTTKKVSKTKIVNSNENLNQDHNKPVLNQEYNEHNEYKEPITKHKEHNKESDFENKVIQHQNNVKNFNIYDYKNTIIMNNRTQSTFDKVIEITSDHDEIDFEPLINEELKPHQRKEILAMKQLEEQGYILYKSSTNNIKFKTNGAYFRDKFGSGKTFGMLGTIACSTPKKKSIYVLPNSAVDKNNSETVLPVKMEYPDERILDLTVIFVGKVFFQWGEVIERNKESLGNCLYIKDYNSFKQFSNMFYIYKTRDKDIFKNYKIILIRTGLMKGQNFDSEININIDKYTYFDPAGLKPIVHIFSEITKGYCFKRVIFDDMDKFNQTKEFPNYCPIIPSLFTWYISATEAPLKRPKDTSGVVSFDDIPKYLENYATYIGFPSYDNSIHNNYQIIPSKNNKHKWLFTIKAEEKFLEDSINTTKYNFYSITIKNPFERTIKLISSFGTEESAQIQQALNGDAIRTAAELAGITVNNPLDIFEKLLKNEYKSYKKSIQFEIYLNGIKIIVDGLPQWVPIDNDTYNSARAVEIFRRSISHMKQIEKKSHPYYENEYITIIDDNYYENNQKKKKAETIIERVKSNVKEGVCPICADDLSEVDCGITKCCEKVFCDICIKDFIGNKSNSFVGQCPNCRSKLQLTDIVYIKSEMNLDQIIDNKNIFMEEEKSVEVKPKIISKPEEGFFTDDDINARITKMTKQEIILAIINGLHKKTIDAKAVNKIKKNINDKFKIDSLLDGIRDIPQSDEIDKKVLIFAKYKETIDKIYEFLDKSGVKALKLHGTVSKAKELINTFKTSSDIKCLIIHSEFYCAGLNLQFATDIIFTHRISDIGNDKNTTEAQIVGRAQRFGRVCNLNTYWVLYENEEIGKSMK